MVTPVSPTLYQSSTQEGETHIKAGPKGSTYDGRAWDDGFGGQVKQICIWHGDLIHSIQTTYQRQGTNLVSRRHGGVGSNFEVVCLDEPLTWVSGHFGSYCVDLDELVSNMFSEEDESCKVIRSLKFGTSRATYGPFGREVGEPFCYKASTGIIGFHGRSSDDDSGWLNAIGVYVNTMADGLVDRPRPVALATPTLENTVERDVRVDRPRPVALATPKLENTVERVGLPPDLFFLLNDKIEEKDH